MKSVNAEYPLSRRKCAEKSNFSVSVQDPMQASVAESTDTEMYQAVERDLLITNDYEAGLVRNATKAHDQAAGGNEQSGDV